MNEPIGIIVSIDHRIQLLPYHIEHYWKLGFRLFIYALWNGKDNPVAYDLMEEWYRLSPANSQMHIRPSVVCDYNHYNGPAEAPGKNAIVEEFFGKDNWYCCVDLDEFYDFGGNGARIMLERLEAGGYCALHGTFYDRIAADGTFPEIPEYKPNQELLDKTFPCTAEMSRISGCNSNKISFARGAQIVGGRHNVRLPPEKVLMNGMRVHHFKWHHGVLEVLLKRHRAYGSQKLAWTDESLRFYDFFRDPNWHNDPKINRQVAVGLGI